jgi:GTP cyclohydrolase I
MLISNESQVITENEKRKIIEKASKKYKEFLEILKFDVENDQQLQGTPDRVARMYVNELFSGCYESEPKLTVFENTKEYDEMVFLGPISIKSTCSHHIIPFLGEAFIAYIPGKKVVGISKLARIVKWFMRRPQIQEELTKQIADYIQKTLEPKGVAVYVKAQHLCMIARGVGETNSFMKTSSMQGSFIDNPATRAEFFDMVEK